MAYDRIIRLGSFFFENGSFCGMRKRSRVSIRVSRVGISAREQLQEARIVVVSTQSEGESVTERAQELV